MAELNLKHTINRLNEEYTGDTLERQDKSCL